MEARIIPWLTNIEIYYLGKVHILGQERIYPHSGSKGMV
jgi:hypothetical protein